MIDEYYEIAVVLRDRVFSGSSSVNKTKKANFLSFSNKKKKTLLKVEADEKLENTDPLYEKNVGLKIRNSPNNVKKAQTLTFKVRVKVNGEAAILAELDTDSNIIIISHEYFKLLKSKQQLEFLNEKPPIFYSVS